MNTVRVACCVIAVTCALGLGVFRTNAFGALPPKCKAADHLLVLSATPDARLVSASHVSVDDVAHVTCRNIVGYDGPAYVFDLDHHLGLQMLPSAAEYVRDQFAAISGPVTLEHTVRGDFVPYRSFSDAARAKIVAELAGV